MVAGGLSGAVSKTLTAPLERVKILLQIQGMRAVAPGARPHYRGVWSTMATVAREEGLLALFKGNGSNVLRIVPVYALKFSFNDLLRDRLVRRPNQSVKDMSFAQLMYAGTLAGVLQMAATYPIETVRTRMTLSVDLAGGVKYEGIWHCARQTVLIEGWRALYKGLGAALISGAPYVGMQMTLYEMGKNATRSLWPPGSSIPLFLPNLVIGAASGVVAQTIFYPGDTLRRRMQTNGIGGETKIYASTWDCAKKIAAREGVMRGFFGGCWANAVKAVPGAALQFACFDYFKAILVR